MGPELTLNRVFILRSACIFLYMTMRYASLSLLFLSCLLLAPAVMPVAADDGDLADHDRARAALRRGEVMPLRDIIAKAEEAFPGRLLEVELDEEDGRIVYEMEMLSPDGRLIKLVYDARTGTLLSAKGAGLEKSR